MQCKVKPYKINFIFIVIFFLISLNSTQLFAAKAIWVGELHIVPIPSVVEIYGGLFKVPKGPQKILIHVPPHDPSALKTAQFLNELLKKAQLTNFEVQPSASKTNPQIEFLRSKKLSNLTAKDESYDLNIGAKKIIITAATDAGLFYGAMTLWQIFTSQTNPQGGLLLMHIHDSPRFAWRGMLLDSARHYQSIDFIKKLVDVMAVHKLNVLHWHLTDDQAWRIEIKKYPRLTKVGAFYTQEQIRELVAYAQTRQINIVPEIEMPGHASAAIVAYPELGAGRQPLTALPNGWGVFTNLFNPNPTTFAFLQGVLDEVMQLFPSPFIHIGGDEAVKDQWKASADVQALMHELQIKDEDALQSWFVQKIAVYLTAHGRRLVGWDEILQGGLAASTTVMSWHGSLGAVLAARQGHDAIISAWPTLYFDARMSAARDEPPGRGRILPLKEVYDFKVVPDEVNAAEAKHILGLQGQVWTEHIRTEEQAELMSFPRELAVAELGWSSQAHLNWPRFLASLPAEGRRLQSLGLQMSDSPFKVIASEDYEDATQTLKVTLSNQTGFGKIRYTLDGTTPTMASSLYSQPLLFKLPIQLRALPFADDGQILAASLTRNYDAISVRVRDSHHLKMCTDQEIMAIEDDAPSIGKRAVFLLDIRNPCWIYPDADLTRIQKITATVGQIPYNFVMAKNQYDKIHFHPPINPSGELEVRVDSCEGEKIATLPLPLPTFLATSLAPTPTSTALTILPAATLRAATLKAHPGRHNLCFTFTQRTYDPMWTIDQVGLLPTP